MQDLIVSEMVGQAERNSGGHAWSAGLFHSVQSRNICRIRALLGAEIPYSNDRCDVLDDAVVFVCAGVPAACVLSILSILSGNHISYCRAADRRTAFTTPIWRMSRMLYRQ